MPDRPADSSFWDGIATLNDWPVARAAYAYAVSGLAVFPVWWVAAEPGHEGLVCQCNSKAECSEPGKHPLVPWSKEGGADPEQVQNWWQRWPQANIGLALGRCDPPLVVLDLDQRETADEHGELQVRDGADILAAWAADAGVEIPGGGPRAVTGGGGGHLFLTAPADGVVKNSVGWLPLVDLKADGGYVLLSPSLHLSGRLYQWGAGNGAGDAGWGPPPSTPPQLAQSLRTSQSASAVGQRYAGAGLAVEYDYQKAKEEGPRDGERDDFFFRYSSQLRGDGVERQEAERRLRVAWEKADQPPVAQTEFTWATAVRKLDTAWEKFKPDEDKVGENAPVLAEWAAEQRPARLTVIQGGAVAALVDPTPDLSPAEYRRITESGETLTDYGAALRFAALNAPYHKYTPGLGWFTWDGRFWAPDRDGARVLADGWERYLPWEEEYQYHRRGGHGDEGEAERRGRFLEGLHGGNTQKRVIDLARARREMRIENPDAWNPDPWVLCVLNGVLDLRTGLLRAGLPQDLCTNMAPVWFDPAAESKVWDQHVQMLAGFADGSRDPVLEQYLQKWAGYVLTGAVEWQQFLVLYGNSNNGKSRFIEAIQNLLGTGEDGYSSVPEEGLLGGSGHNAKWADMVGKRLVFIDELEDEMAEATVKRMTGDARIRADRKYQSAFTFRVQFKMAFATNNLPPVSDSSGAFWRRIRPVPCLHQIPEELRDPFFLQKLEQEMPGILNWCLEGVRLLLADGLGEDQVPLRVQHANLEYRESEDQLGSFLAETFEDLQERGERDWWWYPNVVVWELYRRWCETGGERPEYGKAGFFRRVAQRGWGCDRTNRRVTGPLVPSGQSKGLVGPRMINEAFGIEWHPRVPRGIGEE